MTSILYPVAETAEAALYAPRGYAAREREARAVAAAAVSFASEAVGPAFTTREGALQAYTGRADDRVPPDPATDTDRGWRRLVPVSTISSSRHAPVPSAKPSYRDGRRWPIQDSAPILWRLSVSYWKIGGEAVDLQSEAARKVRRAEAGRGLAAPALNALARQPLRPVKLQQPLDIGLFEMRPPEAPDTLIPDE